MACFTCGKYFQKSDVEVLKKYKNEFKNSGIERYVYKLSKNGNLMIVRKEYFNDIFQKEIKPNLEKGAEYMHISEFTGA